MDVSLASWLVIAIAVAAANLPCFNDKVFALLPTKWPRKPLFVRLLEMAVLYLVVGAIGFAIESQIGSRFPQTQEFYWIAAGLFIVLGFPGFIVRYLHKRHG